MTPDHVVSEVFAQFAGRTMVPTNGAREAHHIGDSDLLYVYAGEGSELQLLHVDLNQGLWISKTRFSPGVVLPRHFLTGNVFAVTLRGEWYYKEYPQSVNRAGSYLFEPAGSVHTLLVPEQEGITEAWFAIQGANVLIGEIGKPTAIVDAQSALDVYRARLLGRIIHEGT